MKTHAFFTATLLAVLSAAVSSLHGAGFAEAKVTRLENEVKVLKENSQARSAVVGENINAVTSVATGANSRVELMFPDKSLTRLGANSRFTIRGDARTLDLNQGVMFLQVPKNMGGAKVRTGAITAAITGTTAIIEYLPLIANKIPDQAQNPDLNLGGIKLIVLEGEVKLYHIDNPGGAQTIHAGEILFMKKESLNIPTAHEVDLNLMLKSGNKFFQETDGTPNAKQVNESVSNQQIEIKNGALEKTNLLIAGRGNVATMVSHSSNVAHNAQVVHAFNGNGKGGANLLDLFGSDNDNNGLGGLLGNGKGKGKALGLAKGKENGNGNGNGQGNGNGNSNGNPNPGSGNQGNHGNPHPKK